MARLIGDAYIVVYPQTDQFGPQLEAAVGKWTKSLRPNVNVTPVLDKAGIAKIQTDLKTLAKTNVDVYANLAADSAAKIHAQLNAITTNLTLGTKIDAVTLAADKASVQAFLDRNIVSVPIGAKIDPASLASANASLAAFTKGVHVADVVAKLDPASLAAANATLQAALHAQNIPLQVSTTQAVTRLEDMEAQVSVLQTRLMNLRASVNDTGAEAKIAALQVQAAAFARTLASAGAGADFAPLEARLLGMQAAYGKLIPVQKAEDEELKRQAGFWGTLGLQGPGSLIHITDILNASLPPVKLFGGAFDAMYAAIRGGEAELPTLASHLVAVASSAHLTAEAAIEFVAIWAPAAIAVTAFGLAATPTVIMLGKQLNNMNTAAKGTGRAFDSLALSGQSVTAAVKPSVLELFGIGLHTLKDDSGALAPIMATLGQGFDQLAAHASNAFGSGGTGGIFKSGSADALALANSFTQVGRIFDTVFKLVPGYAEILLGFGNDVLTAGADVLQFIEPVLKIGVALHGAVFYGGLFGTAVATGIGKLTPVLANAAGSIANLAGKFSILGGESGKIATGAADAATALDGMAGGPVLLGIGLLVGAIAAVALYLKASKTAAQDFGATLEKSLSASAVTALPTALASALAQANAKATASQQQYTQAVQKATSAVTASNSRTGDFTQAQRAAGAAMATASENTQTYTGTQVQLTQQSRNLNLNLGAIAATYGSTIPQALALASGAQVTSNQLLASGGANWAIISTEIAGYKAEIAVVTPGVGALNQALNALNVTQAQQVTDAQKLTQAYTSWLGIVTGGDSAFSSFEQGMGTLTDAMKAGTDAGVKLTTGSGKLTEQQKLLATSLVGTSTSALAARQAFDQQVTSAVTLYGNLQTMAAVSGDTAQAQEALGKAGRDVVAQLLPLAAGSKTATAEVFALAQVAGFTGPDSFQKLSQWVGNTKNAEGDLNTQTTVLTVSSANLTQAAKNLAAALANQVTAGEASAAAKAANLTTIQGQLAASVENSNGKFTQSAITLAGQYYEALIKSGTGATQAKADVDTFLTKLGATPGVVATVNAALAKLPSKVTVGINVGATASGLITIGTQGLPVNQVDQILLRGLAGGGTIPGASSNGHDNHLAVVKSGELIIPSQHAAKFSDAARRASIPGFAAGGTVGNLAPAAAQAVGADGVKIVAAEMSSVTRALASAITAAQAAAGVPGNVASYRPVVDTVLRALGQPVGDDAVALRQMSTESGGNPTIVNTTDSNWLAGHPSVGLMQVIAGTFDAYAGPYRNTGPFEYGVSVNPLANIYAGLNYAVHAYPDWTSVLGQGHGYSTGNAYINEPVFGVGASGRQYRFGENGPEAVLNQGQLNAVSGHGLPAMTQTQGQSLIQLLQALVKQGAQAPYNQAEAMRQSTAAGVRRGYFATSGLPDR